MNILLTKNDALLIALGCIIGILAAMVMIPALQPAPGPGQAAIAAVPPAEEKIPVISGITNTIGRFATRDEVIAFIRQKTVSGEPSPATSTLPVVVSGSSRAYSFEVDTSTFTPDEYIVIVEAVTEDISASTLFNVLEQPANGLPSSPAPFPVSTSIGKDDLFITIDPIGDKIVGERFQITGTTSLTADAEILVQVYSSSFKPTQKSQSGEFSGATGTIRVGSSAQQLPVPTPVPTLASTRAPTMVPTTAAAVVEREYSKTNVQVRTVDEADIIKTDGTYIYVVTANCLHIVQAFPAEDAEILSTLRFPGQPSALYINNGRVILVATDYQARQVSTCTPGKCLQQPGYTPRTLVYIFSVADPANPQLVREMKIDGVYSSSRMIGSQFYFVTSTPVPYDLDYLELPTVHDDRGGISTPPVYGFNTTDTAYAFSTIGAVDVARTAPVSAKTFLIGSASTIYVSPDRLYIAVPGQAHDDPAPATTIHAFDIDNGKITYASGGTVDGTLLNQYSLDEFSGNLRVATTVSTGSWRWDTGSSSKVTILDDNLKTIGTLAGIAPGERIYAARFMGERLYLVTFRETDPFYVIGLEDPERPVILGELKLPGFSNYLHPYDADHIIGVGKESASGPLKIALFDVSDVNNPALRDSETLGTSYSTSPVLDDPRAFLFDKEKDLLVLPVHLTTGDYYCHPNSRSCTPPSMWGGAYVYGVNPKTGFVLKGKVMHYDDYSGQQNPVKRSLYIEDTLYTMSDAKIVMSDLARSLERVNEVDFR